MKILSINAGSSSLKFTLFNMDNEEEIISGVFERIGIDNSFYQMKLNDEKIKKAKNLSNHEIAFNILIEELINLKVIKNLEEIKGVGHRIVHGGEEFTESVLITKDVMKNVKKYNTLAPLHNPPAILGAEIALDKFSHAPQVFVFDTSFHQTIEKENYLYAVPYEWYEEYNVRRYGFHGTSHKFVSERALELDKSNKKIITCHIGNGVSISAVKDGKCINTSMGLTPNAGLIMGTRSGDIDPTIINYIHEVTNKPLEAINDMLNKESGLLALSGKSSDSRDIEDGLLAGDERSTLAQNMYVNRMVEYISKYYVELGGADAIVFTAGVGENSPITRKQIIDKLKVLNIYLDEALNNIRGKEQLVSTKDSKTKIYVIPTNEELMIARDTLKLSDINE